MSAAAFRRQITAFISQHLSPEARSRRLAEIAETTVAGWIKQGRASPRFRRFVDGVEGAPASAVRSGGRILYEFSNIGEAVEFAVAFLRARCPVGPGAPKDKRYPRPYKDCFVVAVNGRPIPWDQVNPSAIPVDAEIFIYNSQPYSRKIDVQLVGKRRLRFSVPPGLFKDAASAVSRRYGNTLRVERVYSVSFPGQYIRRTGETVQSPALHIFAIE